ncbi:MAG: MBL fold metallo-hydrolase [Bryobacteraceae bacterium]|nr:MBL fold metallo-hydrolase [Bryobacteraceae bacterium]
MRRRAWIGGLGVGLAGVGAGFIYRQAPFFWKQYARELGEPVLPARHRPNPDKWPDHGLHAAWLGHSTVLIKIDGFTVLTDPVFSIRAGLNFGPLTLGVKRIVEPALDIEHLPRIDLILLSHAHMDHFDIPSLRVLENARTQVVTARGTSDLLRPERYGQVQEVGWRETVRVGPLSIRGMEVKHWGARMRTDTWRGYNAYMIAAGRRRVLFGGDTAMTHLFREAGGADLAIMPIGAYNPWIRYHCDPEQAWTMANDARADRVLPVHHKTFHLSYEPVEEPIVRLLEAAGNSARDRVVVHDIGQEFRLA